ncbi:c-type cytochrome [Chloroflexi bacterium TSY]|nr:c-type cytochrome [Chloroflexi bacterium TSY]
MNSLLRSPIYWICGLLLTVLLVFTGCTPDANTHILSPQLGTIEIAERAGAVIVAIEPEAPPTLAKLSPSEIVAGLEELAPDVAAALDNADLTNAEALYQARGCAGCHLFDPDNQVVGPTWYNVGNIAVARAEAAGDPSPAAYLYISISNPNSYLVPGYQGGNMPQNFDELLSPQDYADLIAYLLAQQEEPSQ